MFDQYIPLTKDEKTCIWEYAIIVPDANILLQLYRFGIKLRDKLLSILKDKKILSKLWIPAKVYEEFLRNRVNVISEQWAREDKMRSLLDDLLLDFDKKMRDKFQETAHPYIDTAQIKEALESTIKAQCIAIDKEKENNYKLSFDDDAILKDVLANFSSKIGKPFSDEEVKEIVAEGKGRYDKKIPPGYKDDDKPEENKYSDLIIWKSILKYAAEKQTNVIFVTDDRKEDWWQIEHGKTVGARPELIEEFIRTTGKKILFYSSDSFFNYVDKLLGSQSGLTPADKKDIKKVSFQFGILPNTPSRQKRKPQKKYTVDEITNWFFSNYKDPAEGVPYESREGGYQYFLGGPYEAEEEIYGEFPDIDEETLREAVDIIEADGYEWVKIDEY